MLIRCSLCGCQKLSLVHLSASSLSIRASKSHICTRGWRDKLPIACWLSKHFEGEVGTLEAARGGEIFRWRGHRVQAFGRISRKSPKGRILVGVAQSSLTCLWLNSSQASLVRPSLPGVWYLAASWVDVSWGAAVLFHLFRRDAYQG